MILDTSRLSVTFPHSEDSSICPQSILVPETTSSGYYLINRPYTWYSIGVSVDGDLLLGSPNHSSEYKISKIV